MSNTSKLAKINEPVQILKKIQTVAPDAIIAGGYFRDRFNDVKFNDIDIYIKEPANDSCADVHDDAFWSDFFELRRDDWRSMDSISNVSDTDEEYDIDNNSHLMTVFEMTKNELQYNLIIVDVDPIKYVIAKFDFNICKAYCDGKKIVYTKEFMSDIKHKNISFSDNKTSTSNFTHAMHVHLPKLQKKYPEHTLVIPERHNALYQQYKKKFT